MALTRQYALGTVETYLEAWRSQNPDLICTIFTPTATYHERVMEEITIAGRDAIREYWETKVVGAQANISCDLMALYIDGDTAIAEWEAEFDDLAQSVRKRMKEIAVLTFEDGLISSLREYWASATVGQAEAIAR